MIISFLAILNLKMATSETKDSPVQENVAAPLLGEARVDYSTKCRPRAPGRVGEVVTSCNFFSFEKTCGYVLQNV